MTIPIVLSHPAAKPPKRANHTDAGADLYAVENYTLHPGDRMAIETGVSLAIPEGFYGQVAPRSGLAAKNGVSPESLGIRVLQPGETFEASMCIEVELTA